MSHPKDTFDDAELTSLALEIMNDISTKATFDPKDSFLFQANRPNEPSISTINSSQCNNTLYDSITTTNNTENDNQNDNDSSYIYSIESLPNPSFSSKQYQKPVTLKSIWNPPPQHFPPSITIETITDSGNDNEINDSSLFSTSFSDISTSFSHIKRSQTPKCRVNPIPDFSECIQSKPLKIKKKKKRKKNKNLKDKNKHINNLIWQTPMPKELNPFSPKINKKSMTPNGKYRTYKKQKRKYKNKKLRTQSMTTPPPCHTYNHNAYDKYDTYMIELDGFDIFDCNI